MLRKVINELGLHDKVRLVHRLLESDTALVIPCEVAPATHPCDGSLDHPAARQDGEAGFVLDTPIAVAHWWDGRSR